MELNCPVSLGEVLDKISILRIKSERIKDAGKLAHVRHELARLTAVLGDASQYETFLKDLYEHNTVIWDVEDQLRLKERKGEFDAAFAQLARKAYLTNDKRFEVKAAANNLFNSAIREQKSYEQYKS
jgi:hypothetical protein